MINPTVLDPNLGLRVVVGGLSLPTSMAFLGDNEFFVIEKNSGRVQHVINGAVAATRFDFGAGPVANLPVNFNSERGLLGIALSPNFTNDHNVYLFWTESSTGVVTNVVGNTPTLGNRVDRFIWNNVSSTLTFDRNIVRLRAFQNDGNGGNPNQMAGNHDGGVIRFGPDGKLYVVVGDVGRRGWMQNLVNGALGQGQTDENNGPVRGGPAPDDAHLTSVMLRLNPDGSTPTDNPFADISATFQAPLLSGPDTGGRGLNSFFTAYLNQARDKLTVNLAWENLGGPTLPGGAFITLNSASGPAIFAMPDMPGGLTSGGLVTTITTADFIPEPAFGINTWNDALNALATGRAFVTFYTRQFPGGAVSGQITTLSAEVTANIQQIYAYGLRNMFGFTWDPVSGKMWLAENGNQSFDKISIVEPGANNGWVQSMSPLLNFDGTLNEVALAEFRQIELQRSPNGLQQNRWQTANIATSAQQAMNRLLMLPGAHYNMPVLSFRGALPPAGIGFLNSTALGAQYQHRLFMGEARDFATSALEQFDGALFVWNPTSDRTRLDFGGDPNFRTSDGVFLNVGSFDVKSLYPPGVNPSFLFAEGMGIVTEILTGPNGNLYVVSNTKGQVYEIYHKNLIAPFQQKNLVASVASPAGGAPTLVDASLKNPWGISFSPTSPFWTANQATGTTTLYAGDVTQANGTISPITKTPMTITIPPRAGGTTGLPTGTVRNGTTDFRLTNGNPAAFIFNGLDGTLSAWHVTSGTTAELKATIAGASYTGLAIGTNSAGSNFLYAANNNTGRIDVFNTNYQLTTLGPGAFQDPNLPPGTPYRAFNIQNLGGILYVTYNKITATDREHGGIVNAFDLNGNFLRRVVSDGVNAPWGVALAPANFGPYSNMLLVGNFGFGDGKINVYNPTTGAFLGNLTDANGIPIAIEGLWALSFGNGGSGGDRHALYFAAGINRVGAGSYGAANGLFGSIRFVTASSSLVGPDDPPAGSGSPSGGDGPGLVRGIPSGANIPGRSESAATVDPDVVAILRGAPPDDRPATRPVREGVRTEAARLEVSEKDQLFTQLSKESNGDAFAWQTRGPRYNEAESVAFWENQWDTFADAELQILGSSPA